MRFDDPTRLVEWIVTSLRWLTLVSFAVSLATGEGLSLEITLLLFVASCWNIFLTLLAALNRRLLAHKYVNVAGDMLIAYLIFYLSGALHGNLIWAGLLPLFSAALFFQMRGALLVTLANIIIQGVLALFNDPPLIALVLLGGLLLLYLVVGVFYGYIVRRIMGILSLVQRSQLASRREDERAKQERRRALYELISALNASLNYPRVLENALDLSIKALAAPGNPEDRLVSAVLLYTEGKSDNNKLRIGSARRFTPADKRIALPGTGGMLGRAIETGEPCISRDLVKDPELGRIVAVRACQVAYCVPLRTGLDTYGVLLFSHPDGEYFTTERREILNIIGDQAVIAIQNARLYRDLELEKERIMEIQEDARKKLARDLHDGPTQSVAALAMRVNFARRLIDRDEKAAVDELYKIEDLARRTTKEIRHMLFTLRPLVLESQGLVAALESMAEKMLETYKQNVSITADPDIVSELEMAKQGVIFYIVDEAVNNARKHADAPHTWVRLEQAGEDLALLEIEDDGIGFDVNSVDFDYENRGSLGLVNMRERAELVNGLLEIDSTEGEGTRIKILFPLTEEAADRIRRGL